MSRDGVGTPIGVIAALPAEGRCLTDGLGRRSQAGSGADPWVCISGVGQARAYAAASSLAARGACALVSFGTAGALAPGLRAGTVVLGTAVVVGRDRIASDRDWRARIAQVLAGTVRVEDGAILHADAVLAAPADKSRLFLATGALAVDMESAGVARAAAEHELPWLAIRAIVDAEDVAIPPLVLEALAEDGHPRLGRLLYGIARAPSVLPALVRLGRDFHSARATLKAVVRRAGSRLCYGPATRSTAEGSGR